MVLCPLQVGYTGLGAIKRKEIAPSGPAGKWIPRIPSVLDSSGLEVLVRRKGMLPPGGTARVSLNIKVQLPRVFSRIFVPGDYQARKRVENNCVIKGRKCCCHTGQQERICSPSRWPMVAWVLPWQIPMGDTHSLRSAGWAGGKTWGSGADGCHQLAVCTGRGAGWEWGEHRVGSGGRRRPTTATVPHTHLLEVSAEKETSKTAGGLDPRGSEDITQCRPKGVNAHADSSPRSLLRT